MNRDMYRANILDHYKNPRNYGRLEGAAVSHEDDNPLCGDSVRMEAAVQEGRLSQIRFEGEGCAISQAAASILTEVARGKTVDQVKSMGRDDMLQELGIQPNPMRIKCALLALKVLQAGIQTYEQESKAGQKG